MTVNVSPAQSWFRQAVKTIGTRLPIYVSLFAFILTGFASQSARSQNYACSNAFNERRLPSERLNKASPEAQKFWSQYNANFQQEARKYIRKHISEYLEAKNQNDPFITFLESLGFEISEAVVHIPNLVRMMDKVEVKISKLIAEGSIQESEAVWPQMNIIARELSDGQLIKILQLQPGAEIPGASTLEEFSANHTKTELLKNYDLAQLIQNGFYPVGGLKGIVGDRTVELLHDLAHFSAMISHPDYMKAVRKGQTEVLRDTQTKEVFDVYFNGAKIGHRFFLAMETLTVVRPETRSLLPKLLNLELVLARNPNPTVHQIQEHYESLSEKELESTISQLDPKQILEGIGGATRDLQSQLALLDSINPSLYLFNKALTFRSSYRLAKLSKYLLATKDLTAEQWAQSLMRFEGKMDPRLLELGQDGVIFSSQIQGENFLLKMFSKDL